MNRTYSFYFIYVSPLSIFTWFNYYHHAFTRFFFLHLSHTLKSTVIKDIFKFYFLNYFLFFLTYTYDQRWAKSSNLVILKIKIEINTNYEFLKSKSIQNVVISKIKFKITFKLWVFIIYNNLIWVILIFHAKHECLIEELNIWYM